MIIYIASSWKNQHAVEMLTSILRKRDYKVLSFVENNHGEYDKSIPFEEWVESEKGRQSFEYDTDGATKSDLIIYISPSGTDAWAEIGAAWCAGRVIFGLWAKGEQAGLMRKMMTGWFTDFAEMLAAVDELAKLRQKNKGNT